MIEGIYSEDTEILKIPNSDINEKYYNWNIYVMYKSSVCNKLVYGSYSFFIFALNWMLITSFYAQDKHLVPL